MYIWFCVDGGWLSELNHLMAELNHLIAELNHLIAELNHLIALPKPLNPPMNLQVGAVVCVDSARLRRAQG
jgi:hypothetical protein